MWRIIRPDWKRTTRSHISWALSNCYKWGLGCEVKSQHEPCSHLLGAKANQPLAPVANESMISSNQAVWKPNTVSVPHAICHLLTVLSAQIYLNSDKRSAGCLFWPLIWWCNQMRRQRPTVWAQTVSVVSFPQILNLICVLWSRGAAHTHSCPFLHRLTSVFQYGCKCTTLFYKETERSAQCRCQLHLTSTFVPQRKEKYRCEPRNDNQETGWNR